MGKSKQIVEITKGNLFEINPKGKYLIIFPKDAQIRQISEALGTFFKPAQVFCLAAQDVNSIKITELIGEED